MGQAPLTSVAGSRSGEMGPQQGRVRVVFCRRIDRQDCKRRTEDLTVVSSPCGDGTLHLLRFEAGGPTCRQPAEGSANSADRARRPHPEGNGHGGATIRPNALTRGKTHTLMSQTAFVA